MLLLLALATSVCWELCNDLVLAYTACYLSWRKVPRCLPSWTPFSQWPGTQLLNKESSVPNWSCHAASRHQESHAIDALNCLRSAASVIHIHAVCIYRITRQAPGEGKYGGSDGNVAGGGTASDSNVAVGRGARLGRQLLLVGVEAEDAMVGTIKFTFENDATCVFRPEKSRGWQSPQLSF